MRIASGPAADRHTFGALRIRNFRLFVSGAAISHTCTWMSRITQDWLVLALTGSVFSVGVIIVLQFLPTLLLGLYGGVVADRYSRRETLLVTQSVMGVLALALAVLTLSGHVEVWHVYVVALLHGAASVVDNPARDAFIAEMVGPDQVPNAFSISAAVAQSARLVGPAVAGVLITVVGNGWAFLLNGLSFLATITVLLMMRTADLHSVERAPRARGQLRAGLRHVVDRPELLWPTVLVGAVGTFGFSFPVWLSAFVRDVFHADAGTYGLLNTSLAAGSVAGALIAARIGTLQPRFLLAAALMFGLLEVFAALSSSLWLFVLLLPPVGLSGLVFTTAAAASMQLAADPPMRGRVASIFTLAYVGGNPLGGALAGTVTDAFGPRIGLAAAGTAIIVVAATVGLIATRRPAQTW